MISCGGTIAQLFCVANSAPMYMCTYVCVL